MAGIDFESVPLTIDYTDRDFTSIVASLREFIVARFPQITDFNTSSLVEMQIEVVAAVFDRLSNQQDFQANESFIVTARLLRNVIKHARGISYTPRSNQAATGPILATIPAITAGNVDIPAGTIIATKDTEPIEFQVTQAFTITAGNTTATGTIKNSATFTQEFETTLTANQRVKLNESPFIDDGSAVLTIASQTWEQVGDFFDSGPADLHYRIEVGEDGVAEVVFSDGVNGAIPPNDGEITYQTGGGRLGNQSAGTITENSDDFVDSLGNPVAVTFTNTAATEGGTDAETLDEIRYRAPSSLKALTSTVAREDFTINLEAHVPGVSRAIAFFRDQNPALDENHAYIQVVPEDMSNAGQPSSTLKTNIQDFLLTRDPEGKNKPVVATMDVTVLDTNYVQIEPKCDVYYQAAQISNLATFKQQVRDNIEAFFDYTTRAIDDRTVFAYSINWGKIVRWSQVLKEIQKTSGVLFVQNFKFNNEAVNTDFDVAFDEIPELVLDNFDTPSGINFIAIP